MAQQLLMALGAGAASAILFILPAKGSLAGLAFGVLAPLPLMIVALGLGERMSAAAAAIGAVVIALMIDPIVSGAFLLSVAAPALLLGFLGRRPGWGAPGVLLLVVALVAMLAAWSLIAIVGARYPSFGAALDDLAQQLAPQIKAMIEATDARVLGLEPQEVTRWVLLGMPPIAAAWSVAALSFNLWAAGRIAAASGQLPRPWAGMPETLRLPRVAFALVGVAVLGGVVHGLPRLLAATALAAFLVAFALHGLATLHALTRGRAGRPAILSGFYALCLALFPWPLVLAAGLGLTDAARPFLRPSVPPSPATNRRP